MRKTLIVTQVLLGVALLGFLVYRFFFQTVPPLLHDPASWNHWAGFYAVSYTGLSKEENASYLSPKGFEDHLKALKAAGFLPLAPEDVAAFYRDGRPLPAKGILILFEGGRKDSFLLATPILKKNGFLATMAVPTALAQSWDAFYLKKGDLKKLDRSPYWRLASMGHEAYKKITDHRGRTGHFLTGRLASGSRPEDETTFQARITGDYQKAASFLAEITGRPITAYLYPFADSGSGPEADPLAFSTNRKAVSERHTIAFVGAHHPFNGRDRDPWQLTRLRVPSSWDGRQLVKELEKSAPQTALIDGMKMVGVWQSDKTPSFLEGVMRPPADSLHWLRGTEDWGDQEVTLKVHLSSQAQIHLFLRYLDRDNHLVLSITSQEAALREKQKGSLQTLAVKPVSINSSLSRRFRLRIKTNRAWCWMDEKLLFGPVPLSSPDQRGKIGLSVQGDKVSIEEFQARPLLGYYVFSKDYNSLPPEKKADLQGVFVSWKDGSPAFFSGEKQKRDVLIAAAEGVQTIPVLTLPPSLPPAERERFVAQIRKTLEDPLLKPFIRTLALSGADTEWISSFHAAGFKIIQVIRPEEAEKMQPGQSQPAADRIWIDGPSEAVLKAVNRLLYRIPAHKLIASTDKVATLPQGVCPTLSF